MASSVPPGFPPGPQAPFPPKAPLPPGKKPNILIWILGGVVVLVLGSTMMCGIGGFLLMHKAKEAGLDTSLLKTNPAYAAAKMAAALNPDAEVLSTDDSTGTIKVREKTTGKTTTMRFDAEKKQMVVIDGEGKQSTVSITGEGDSTSVNFQSADGTAKFSAGGDNQMPAWVPVYPGSTPKGTFSASNVSGSNPSGSNQGTKQSVFGFKTTDAPSKVMEYYQNQLKSSGFNVTQTFSTPTSGMLSGENGSRTLTITASAAGSETSASLVAVEKQ